MADTGKGEKIMNKASPVELRTCLEVAHALASIGIRFVPMPVLPGEDHQTLAAEHSRRMDVLLAEAEKAEAGR